VSVTSRKLVGKAGLVAAAAAAATVYQPGGE
jgi:hypothetical protein